MTRGLLNHVYQHVSQIDLRKVIGPFRKRVRGLRSGEGDDRLSSFDVAPCERKRVRLAVTSVDSNRRPPSSRQTDQISEEVSLADPLI